MWLDDTLREIMIHKRRLSRAHSSSDIADVPVANTPSVCAGRIVGGLLALALALLPALSFASSADETKMRIVKANLEYVSGFGEGCEIDAAREAAESDLAKQIQVSITVKTSTDNQQHLSGDNAEISQDYSRQQDSFSFLNLSGLQYIKFNQGNQWQVLAYIHRDSLAKSYSIRKEKIRDFYNSGRQSEENNRIGSALRYYYWGYLLAKTYPDTIRFTSSDGSLSSVPSVAFKELIERTIQNINISSDDCYKDGGQIIAPLRFTYNGQDIHDLSFSYYCGPGTQYGRVLRGIGNVPLFDNPIYSTYILTVSIEYVFENEMADDPEIAGLHSNLDAEIFNNLKPVNLNIPWNTSQKRTVTVQPVTPPSPPAPPEIPQPRQMQVMDAPDPIEVLWRQKLWGDFSETLLQYEKLGKLSYGKQSDFADGAGCWVAISDDYQVVDIMYFDGMKYRGIKSGKEFDTLKDDFKGKRMIWIKPSEIKQDN